MINRIVKLTFKPEHITEFKEFVKTAQVEIRKTEGCSHLNILQDIKSPNIFFTYSHWQDEVALNNYRKSEFFRVIWPKTKQWFDAKPEAWSTEIV